MRHGPGLADDTIGAAIGERIKTARQVAAMRTERFSHGSVLTNNDPSSSGKERFQSEHEEVEVSDSRKNEAGPQFPNESKQAETAVADALCAERMNGDCQMGEIVEVRICDQCKMDVILRGIESAREGFYDPF
jgi:hypothetical protein